VDERSFEPISFDANVWNVGGRNIDNIKVTGY
jgi:hypothetical protein